MFVFSDFTDVVQIERIQSLGDENCDEKRRSINIKSIVFCKKIKQSILKQKTIQIVLSTLNKYSLTNVKTVNFK